MVPSKFLFNATLARICARVAGGKVFWIASAASGQDCLHGHWACGLCRLSPPSTRRHAKPIHRFSREDDERKESNSAPGVQEPRTPNGGVLPVAAIYP